MNKEIKEVMCILQEEFAEVTQAVSKCFRFGFENAKHDIGQTNGEHLAEELGDLLCMIQIAQDTGIVDPIAVELAKQAKYKKLQKWSNIQNLENI
jgi:NTP pyrophosphatase (non-canonical NTP hydrolase)